MGVTDPATGAPLKVGMLGGAFDPPHKTHVALAEAAIAQLGLDILYVIPTGQAWHKTRALTQGRHRLALCALAFADVNKAQVDAREIERGGPSYTVDTLHELHAQHPQAEFYLVMGADQARALPTWSRAEELRRLAIICVAGRGDSEADAESIPQAELDSGGFRILQLPPSPVSATAVRQQLASQQSIEALVPPAVARYIEEHHLYPSS